MSKLTRKQNYAIRRIRELANQEVKIIIEMYHTDNNLPRDQMITQDVLGVKHDYLKGELGKVREKLFDYFEKVEEFGLTEYENIKLHRIHYKELKKKIKIDKIENP